MFEAEEIRLQTEEINQIPEDIGNNFTAENVTPPKSVTNSLQPSVVLKEFPLPSKNHSFINRNRTKNQCP